jgi:hypothetical protein
LATRTSMRRDETSWKHSNIGPRKAHAHLRNKHAAQSSSAPPARRAGFIAKCCSTRSIFVLVALTSATLPVDDASTWRIVPAGRRQRSCNGKLRPCMRQIKAREPCGARAKSKAREGSFGGDFELADSGNPSHCLSVAYRLPTLLSTAPSVFSRCSSNWHSAD